MATTRRKTQKQADDAWPLGRHLREARGRMSIREAARRADISESRWRQVEAGVQKMAGGLEVPVHPRPETVAAMCRAVGADVEEGMRLADHDPKLYGWLLEDAAGQLTDADRLDWFAKLPRKEREEVLAELQRVHVDTELGKRQPGRKAV